jgi:hypothetical protein
VIDWPRLENDEHGIATVPPRTPSDAEKTIRFFKKFVSDYRKVWNQMCEEFEKRKPYITTGDKGADNEFSVSLLLFLACIPPNVPMRRSSDDG